MLEEEQKCKLLELILLTAGLLLPVVYNDYLEVDCNYWSNSTEAQIQVLCHKDPSFLCCVPSTINCFAEMIRTWK